MSEADCAERTEQGEARSSLLPGPSELPGLCPRSGSRRRSRPGKVGQVPSPGRTLRARDALCSSAAGSGIASPSSARLSAPSTALCPEHRPGGRFPGRAPRWSRQEEPPGPAVHNFPGRAPLGPAESGGRCRPRLRASPSPEHPPAPSIPPRRSPSSAPGINTRGNNHLVVVVVTQTLGKVQVGGVSGERAARRSRVKSYIHAGGSVHLETPPGGLIDPPSSAFPGEGARAERRGSGAASKAPSGDQRVPGGHGDSGGRGGGKVQVNKEKKRGG